MSKTPVENAPQAPAAETLEQRFRRLEAAWEAETQFLSYTFPVRLSHLVDFLGRPLMRVRSLCRTVWK